MTYAYEHIYKIINIYIFRQRTVPPSSSAIFFVGDSRSSHSPSKHSEIQDAIQSICQVQVKFCRSSWGNRSPAEPNDRSEFQPAPGDSYRCFLFGHRYEWLSGVKNDRADLSSCCKISLAQLPLAVISSDFNIDVPMVRYDDVWCIVGKESTCALRMYLLLSCVQSHWQDEQRKGHMDRRDGPVASTPNKNNSTNTWVLDDNQIIGEGRSISSNRPVIEQIRFIWLTAY